MADANERGHRGCLVVIPESLVRRAEAEWAVMSDEERVLHEAATAAMDGAFIDFGAREAPDPFDVLIDPFR